MNVFTSKISNSYGGSQCIFFTFTSKVEKTNHGAKDNYVNPIDSIVTMIKNCL
jgi:hypothetical protein